MQLTRVLTVLTLAAALALPALADCPRVTTDGQSLWLEDGANRRLVASDPNGISLPSLSGDRIAYGRERQDGVGVVHTEIVVLKKDNGEVVRVLTAPEDTAVNGLLQVGWRDSSHVFLEGHVNPATTLYLEWSVGSGALSGERPGSLFAVSPNGRSVAQQQHVPLGAPEEFNSAVLEVDGVVVYPATTDVAHHRFLTPPVWARDSHRLALIDEVSGATDLLVVSLDGRNTKTSRVHLTLGGTAPRVSWSGDFVIVRTDQEALRIQPQTGRIEPAAPGDGESDGCSH